jgi:3-hydroxy-9,10-secoandrosta-1,3,5(10)-triene-9,17-dione monooxygenase reductase component
MHDELSVPLAAPKPQDPAEYRKALSCFATGVTVVTAQWQDQDWGMTCNSFASVSLEPRLVLWSIRKAASSLDAFTQSGGFTVNVLSNQQEAIARQFATGDMASRFSGVPVQRQASQRQRLTDAMAWFDCQLHQLVDAGDHHIVIGQVNEFGWHEDAQALGFCRSRFGQFEALAA